VKNGGGSKSCRLDKKGNEVWTEKEMVDFDDVYSMWRPLHEFYFDPSRHIEECKDMFWEEVLHINEFRRKYGQRRGFEKTKDVPTIQQITKLEKDMVGKVKAGSSALESFGLFFQVPKDELGKDDVHILHYYNRSTDEYCVLANGVLCRNKPIPYPSKELPVSVFYCYKDPQKFYGYGIPKIVKMEAAELSTIANMRLDFQKRSLDKMFFMDDTADIEDLDLVPRPHGIVPVNTQGRNLRDVMLPMEYSDVKVSSYQDQETLYEVIRRRTGIDDRIQGVDKGGTATEAAILKEAAQKRINAISIFSEIDGLKRLGKIRWANIVTFYSTPRIKRIVLENGGMKAKTETRTIKVKGKEFFFDQDGHLQVKDIDGISTLELNKKTMKYLDTEVDVVINVQAGTQLSKPLKQAKYSEMFDRLVNPAVIGHINVPGLIKGYVEVNEQNVEDILRPQAISATEMFELADAEFEAMLAGLPVPATPGATEEHIMHEMALARDSQRLDQAPPEIQQALEQHIADEDAALRGGSPTVAPGVPSQPLSMPGQGNLPAGPPNLPQGAPSPFSQPNANPVDLAPQNINAPQ
jgi:hypothetical protein